jgi:hypothetical protein
MDAEPLGSIHVDDTLLAAYLDRRLSDEDRDRLEDHLAGCDTCRERLLAATGTLRGERRRTRARSASAVAVVTVGIAGVFFLVPSSPTPGSPQLRSGSSDPLGAAPALEAVTPTDGETVVVGSTLLVWRSVDGAARYRITVSDPESGVVFEKDVADTVVSLGSMGPLAPGEAYVWYVDALLPDGRSVTTGVRSFSVRP